MTRLREILPDRLPDRIAFRRLVAEPCLPVVIPGACDAWPLLAAARRSWSELSDYLSRFDAGLSGEVFVGERKIGGRYDYRENLEGFNFDRKMMGITEALASISASAQSPDAPSIYMGSLPLDDYLPGLATENRLDMLDFTVRPRIWLGNASSIACHYDMFDNLACVIAGRRRFTLYPPDAIEHLYVGPIDHTMAGQPVGLAAGSAPGDPRYPKFEEVRDRAVIVDLIPGDALYLPKLWWHQVEATDEANLLVNYWWDGFSAGPDAPYSTLMLAMIAIAERPPRERAAWRAFFDHYVFRQNGHPLAHLPEDKHGVLGPLRAGNYGRIRAMVMQMLRGG